MSGAKSKNKKQTGDKPQKVMVPRKKLQSVPDLLARGPDGTESEEEPIWIKILWIGFLLLLFYISFDYFLKNVDLTKKSEEL